jgi:hypothetical protein
MVLLPSIRGKAGPLCSEILDLQWPSVVPTLVWSREEARLMRRPPRKVDWGASISVVDTASVALNNPPNGPRIDCAVAVGEPIRWSVANP